MFFLYFRLLDYRPRKSEHGRTDTILIQLLNEDGHANWRDWFHENILEGWDSDTPLTSYTRCTVVMMLLEDFGGWKLAQAMRSSTVTCFYFRHVFISIFLRMISGKKLIRPSREIQIPSGAARFTKDRYHYLHLPLPFLGTGCAVRFYG